nr:serine/arginine repetitive matrix protein 1-like [Aegilops tauschii subsp. strangulata]
MPGLLRPWPHRPAPLPPRHSSEPREFVPAAPSPLHRAPRPAPPLPPRRCAYLLSSRRAHPLSGRIRSAVVVPGAPDLPCFAKFAAPPRVSVGVDLLPRRSTSPRRQQASLPPLFTKSQLLPCAAGSSSNLLPRIPRCCCHWITETDPPRNPVFNYTMSGKYHYDGVRLRGFIKYFFGYTKFDYTARPIPGPSIFSENFAKYHDIRSPGYNKTVPDNVKYLYRRPRTSTKTCTTTVAEDTRNGTVKFNYLRRPLLPSTILNPSENARFEAPSLLLVQRRSAIPTSSRARPGARPPSSRTAMPGLLRPWPRRPAPLPPRHSSEPREFVPAAPSPLHRPPRPAPPLPPRRCACLLSSRRPRPLSGRIRSAVVVPGAPDLPCFAKFAASPWVSVGVDLLPRRSTSPRRQQASLPPLFTKSQLLPCAAGSSSNLLPRIPRCCCHWITETDPPRNPEFNYTMSGKYHYDGVRLRGFIKYFFGYTKFDYTARPIPGPSIFSENFAKYHDIRSPGYTKTVPDNVKFLFHRPSLMA